MVRCVALGIVATSAIVALFTTAAPAQDRVVNIYNWSDYIDPKVLIEFTNETGIKVVYDNYDNNEIVEAKLLAGGSGYDIAVPTERNMQRLAQVGVLQRIDKSKLPNLIHLWPEITRRLAEYDPGNEHSVNYMWGTIGIGYNVAMIESRLPDAPVDSLKMLFDPLVISKFADCGVHLLDSPEDVVPAALTYLGLDTNTRDPNDLEKVGELLASVRPYIQKFHSSEYLNALANGDICLAFGYSGDVFQAGDRALEAGAGVEVGYTIPREGGLIWFDSFVIPTDAPHPEEAYEFINYMLRPEVAAANSNFVFYANGNIDSQPLLAEDVIGDPAIYPGAETFERLYTVQPYDPATQRLVTRMWTSVKSGT